MKKYSKAKNKTPIKKEEKTKQDYTDTITQIYKENELENDFIYVIDPLKKNVVKTRNTKKTEILNNTLKMETKTIKIFNNDFNEEKIEVLNSEKKSKKKKIKKKKKSVKKDVTPDGELEKKTELNAVNGLEIKTPTPNGNDSSTNFYLIDYNSQKKREINGINEPNPIMTEDNYNTFHENELEENNKEENRFNDRSNTIYDEKLKKADVPLSSSMSNKIIKTQSHKSLVKKKKIPEKLSFDFPENKNNFNNDISEVKHDKLRKIKFRKNDDNKKNKVIDLIVAKNNENEKTKFFEKDTSDDNMNEKSKEKNTKSPVVHKKKKKVISKKKLIANVNKIIIIQSLWRGYQARKLIKLNKKFEEFTFIFNLLMNKRLKSNLQFLLEQMNSIISNTNNNININNNKIQKDKKKKKFKAKKIKIRNMSEKNIINSSEENSLKIQNELFEYEKNKNGINKKNSLYEVKKLSFNKEEKELSFPKKDKKAYSHYIIKEQSINDYNNNNNNNNNINNENIGIKDNSQNITPSQKEQLLQNLKSNSKFKLFRIQRIKREERNLSLSYDNMTIRKYIKPEVKPKNLKKHFNKSIDISSSLNYNSIPVIKHDYLNTSFSKNKFPSESLINCHNDDLCYMNVKRKASYYKKIIGENPFLKSKSKKINKNDFSSIKFLISLKGILSKIIKKKNFYYLLGYLKLKSLLQNLMNIFNKKKASILKNAFSNINKRTQMLKFLAHIKNEEKIKKKRNMKISSIKPIFINRQINKDKKNLLLKENIIETSELCIMGNYNKKDSNKINKFEDEKLVLTGKVCNLKINKQKNKSKISIDKKVISFKIKESYKKEDSFNKNKLIISKIIPKFEINKQIKERNIFIDKINDFNIRESYKKENKFKENKLIITKSIPKINIYKQKKENNIFIIDKIISKFNIREKYNKEMKFNNKKLIISKTVPKININKKKNENCKFIIDKVISKFNIKNVKKSKEFIITKLISESPIINMIKKSYSNNFIITRVINKLNVRGILKNNNHVINRVVNDCIIDDIELYNKNNKLKYYYSLIMNNINNLIINNTITDFNIISKKVKSILAITNTNLNINSRKDKNYIITKNINDYISGNSLILKNLYKFNTNELIITKVIRNLMIKMKGDDKIKRQIVYSSSLLKMKSVIIKNVHEFIYPLLINIMKKYCFCDHLLKFDKIRIKLMKMKFINNLKYKKLEEKYKKLYLKNKFSFLIINRVIKYDIKNNKNNIFNNEKIINENAINFTIEENKKELNQKLKKNNENQILKKFVIHKVKLFSMNSDLHSLPNNEKIILEKLYAKKKENFIKGNVITKKINLFIENNKKSHKLSESKNNEKNSNKQTPINSPNSSGETMKNENKNKIYYSRVKINNSKNLNNLNYQTKTFNYKKENSINSNNSLANSINNITNNDNNNNLNNSTISVNSNILNNTFTNISSLNKMSQNYQINNSPSLDFNKIIYSKKKTQDEKDKFIDKTKNIKEKRLNFNRIIYNELQGQERKDKTGLLLKEINEGQSKEEKEADEQEQEEYEVEPIKDNFKIMGKNIKTQQKKYEEKEPEEQVEKIYIKDENNKNKYIDNNKANINNNHKEYEEEEEEEEELEGEEDESDESDITEEINEILIKYITRKNNILNQKLLNAFKKWVGITNYSPSINTKNNNVRKIEKEINRNDNFKDICENGGVDRNKKLFIIYRKYNDYSYIMKKKYLRKWKKVIKFYGDYEEVEYDEEEDEEVEDEEEEEEIEKKE